ncbi:MAG: coproporphyrinogen dehydrogenase HemZ [Clostridiales bacterium]|nr:coproporphyrinogen dehydrogenase HemZ [Clostridiales bacterium]
MELIQRGYSCAYEMNVFLNIFFGKDEKGTVITDFIHENDVVRVHTEIIFENKKFEGNYSFNFKNSESDEKKKKKIYGCCCMKSFCNAAKKIRNIPLPWGVMSGIRPAKNVRQLHDEGYDYEEVKKIIRDIYGVSEEKCELAVNVAKNEEEILKRAFENSVSIYIGIPFCPSRCLYCSFVSTDIKHSGIYMDEFCRLLCREIEKTGEILKELGFSVQNIYIGGGTPTTLSEENLGRIFESINKNIDLSRLDEFTLEAGRPDTITEEKLMTAKYGGVNRISINPQTMNDETLVKIGRKHTVEEFLKAFAAARKLGFENINTDLIAGLPDENFNMFKKSIDEILKLNPEEVTVHSMCVKRAAALKLSEYGLTGYEEMNKMLGYAQKKMMEAGKEPYYMYRQKNISGNLENVGYADKSHMSSYNINIMEEIQTIIALGGGGASKVVMGDRIERVVNFKEPYEYIRRFDEILEKKEEIAEFYRKSGKGEEV